MQYRTLGRTGLKTSCIGFGALPYTGLTEKEASDVLNTALDRGINFIDTARGYRESEALIGKSASHRRSEYFLATKTRARDEKTIRQELAISLHNLKTDLIDLYQVHYVNTSKELQEVLKPGGTFDTFQKLREEGVIRFIGISGHDATVLLQAAQTGKFDTIQGAFSYVEKTKQVFDCITYCSTHNIAFINQKPLAGGAVRPAPAGLKWILQHPVSTVIPGMVTVEQVIENTAVADSDYNLTAEEKNALDEQAGALEKNFCRRCYYCHPVCPENIRIGVILEFYGKAQYPENLALARRWYQGMEINAANCTRCGLCEQECPYNLPIMELLEKAHALLGSA